MASGGAGSLDLFVLTFNAAKNLIDVGPFASHLHAALVQGAAGTGPGRLPELVALNLQEVAPLSYSFIGSYFLAPYYSRYDEALNLAADRILAPAPSALPPLSGLTSASPTTTDNPSAFARARTNGGSSGSTPGGSTPTGSTPPSPIAERALSFFIPSRRNTGRKDPAYTLIRAQNVGMTAIMLFARDPACITRVLEAETSFGAADIGNKGAVGLRVAYEDPNTDEAAEDDERQTTELTFVSAHLAAMEWNLKKRNANWRSIVSGLTFANPKSVLAALGSRTDTEALEGARESTDGGPVLEGEGDSQPLLHAAFPRSGSDSTAMVTGAHLTPAQESALHAISIFSPSSHLFVAGDLNYRISTSTPPALAMFPSFDKDSENHWSEFLPRDQLTQEREAGRTLHGLSEAEIKFGPSYKYVILGDGEDDLVRAVNEDAVREGRLTGVEGDQVPVVPWKWAGHRWPSWCDRVLWAEVPEWVRRSKTAVEGEGKVAPKVYSVMPVVTTSDHRAVFLRASVPLISPETLATPPPAELVAQGKLDADPRVKLPVPVDLEAWERRAAARQKELWVGWSMYLWSTRDGAVLIGTVVLVSVVSWWAYRVIF